MTTMQNHDNIYCAFPKSQYLAAKPEIDAAIHKVLDGGRYILGEEVRAFEQEFAAYTEAQFCVTVGNGTDAIHLALRALNVGVGDEVVTVSHTAVATVAAIELTGATPVLVDIDPTTYTISVEHLSRAITPRTKAVVAVHLYGHPCDLDSLLALLKPLGIPLIEDCAQAHGARWNGRRVGSLGALGCFSFYPTKNLGAIGDGGAVVTSDPALAERLRLLREYGWKERYVSTIPGLNTRLDELQAALLRVKLTKLDTDNARRRAIAQRYTAALSQLVTCPVARAEVEHVFHLYVARIQDRDRFLAYAQERGVFPLVHYPVPIHLQPAYSGRVPHTEMHATETAAKEIVSLPMYPELTDEQVDTVITVTRDYLRDFSLSATGERP